MLLKEVYLPAKAGSLSVHSTRNASRYSSVTLPRSAKGVVTTASNSAFSQPAPMPTTRRPPESTSMVESILAASTGWRCGTTMTASTRRMREVFAATKAVMVSCSWRCMGADEVNSPDSE